MTEPVRDQISMIARASATRLAGNDGSVVSAVERALGARTSSAQPSQYFDPISLGALIVSIASFAWQVYSDRKSRGESLTHESVARSIRVRIADAGGDVDEATSRVIDLVVTETLNKGGGMN
jgi:hypothetical protein